MRVLWCVGVLLVGMVLAPRGAGAADTFIADSPEQIRPLMIGAPIPDVTLVTPDHRPVVLRDAVATQPTILIYYRGGW